MKTPKIACTLFIIIMVLLTIAPARAGISEADLQVQLTAVHVPDDRFPDQLRYDFIMTVSNNGPEFAEGVHVRFYTVPTTIEFTANIQDMYAGTVKTYTYSTLSAAPVYAYFEVDGWYQDPTPGDNSIAIYSGYQVHMPLVVR